MKILLTGAAGRLGSATYKCLLEAGHTVVATDITRRQNLPGRVIVGDLLDREFCYELTEDVECVVHIANHTHPGAANPQKLLTENTAMNVNVFQAAMESGVKKMTYASSIQAVHGSRGHDTNAPSQLKYLPMDSDTPQNAGNHYGMSKCFGENLLAYYVQHHKLESAVAVRFPLLVHRNWFADYRIRRSHPSHGPLGYVDEGCAWLSVDDAARLFVAIVKSDLPGYRAYIPAHPVPRLTFSPREMLEKFFNGVPLKKPLEQMDAMVDISGITRETGWVPVENIWDENTK